MFEIKNDYKPNTIVEYCSVLQVQRDCTSKCCSFKSNVYVRDCTIDINHAEGSFDHFVRNNKKT